MSPLFAYFWPSAVAGLAIGAIAGTFFHRRIQRRRGRWILMDAAILAAVASSLVWSGPLGGARRFIETVEPQVRQVLDAYEMTQIRARLGRAPLNRQVILEGPADDFQRSELVRIIGDVPGVSIATWGYPGGAIPFILEGAVAALAGLLLGFFLAYLWERHRRLMAEWDW